MRTHTLTHTLWKSHLMNNNNRMGKRKTKNRKKKEEHRQQRHRLHNTQHSAHHTLECPLKWCKHLYVMCLLGAFRITWHFIIITIIPCALQFYLEFVIKVRTP